MGVQGVGNSQPVSTGSEKLRAVADLTGVVHPARVQFPWAAL